MRIWLLSLVAFSWLGAGLEPSQADVRVVPTSLSSNLLQLKSLEAKIEIKQGFALTRSVWTFSNSSDADFEAETTVEAPRAAVVSAFAYWFRGQKVVARVVEKERAERLYQELVHPPTGRPRDPALVEMLSRHFFHAHIAPVAARQDLKIEVVWAQPLKRTLKEQVFDFPLSPNPQMRVDRWTVDVAGANPTTNVGPLRQGRIAGDAQKSLPNYLHFSLPLSQTPTPLISSRGGFFATTGTTPRGASEVFSLTRGGQKLTVGKLKTAPATATDFGEVAHILWSASKLDSLEGSDKNRVAAIHLSIRSGLLCSWTRWLAIPDSERKRLMEARAAVAAFERIQELGPQLVHQIALGKTATPQFKQLQADYERNAKISRQDTDAFMKRWADREMNYLYSRINRSPNSKKPLTGAALEKYNAYILAQMARVKPIATTQGASYVAYAQQTANLTRLGNLTELAFQKFSNGVEDDALNREIQALVPLSLSGNELYSRRNNFQSVVLRAFVNEWARLPVGDARRARWEAKIRALGQFYPEQAERENLVQEEFLLAQYRSLEKENNQLQTQLASQIIAGQEDSTTATQLRTQLDALRAGLQIPPPATSSFLSTRVLPVDGKMQQLAREIQREHFADVPDAAKIAANEKEIERLKTYSINSTFDPMKVDLYSLASELSPKFVKRWYELTSQPNFDPAAEQKLVERYDELLTLSRTDPNASWRWRGDAKYNFAEAETRRVEEKMQAAAQKWFDLQHARVPDPQKSAEALAELEAAKKGVYYESKRADEFIDWRKTQLSGELMAALRAELAKPKPDAELVDSLQRRALEIAPYDWFYRQWQSRRTSTAQEFQRQRMELILADVNLQKAVKARASQDQIAELKQRVNQLRVRVGDPLIAVKAPRTARSIVALLPSGELLPLRFNPQTLQWEARFDIPAYQAEGEFQIQIFFVLANGTRSHLTMRLHVDLSAPSGNATLKFDPQNPRLELECDASTDRVSAFFSSGERVELAREANGLWSAALPVQATLGDKVRFVLTDAAHNRTEITLDLTPSESKAGD